MPSRSTARVPASAAAALAALILAGGCAATVGGTASIDGSALLSSAFASAGNTTAGLPGTLSFNLPAPPTSTTPSSASPSATTPPTVPDSTPVRATSSPPTTAGSTTGTDVDQLVAQLAATPLVADDAARKAADPTALSALAKQIVAARTAGFLVTVVLIGHEVDDLTAVTDAIAQRTGSTSIAVSTSHFAVSSKEFSSAQLSTAEDAASQASTPVDAASALITSLVAQRPHTTGAPTTRTTTRTTGRTTAGKTTSATGGGVVGWARFQLPDGSIACLIDADTVRCDLVAHTYTPPKNPHPDCQGDYGAAVMMTASTAPAFICISDTVADPTLPKLGNGGTTQVGTIMCFSDPPSVTCMNLTSSHGFLIEPDLYQFF
jgi:hypothetical protein